MDSRRVVEIYSSKYKNGGTGYLVQSNLILTAYHVVAPPNKDIEHEAELIYDIRFLESSNISKSRWLNKGASLQWYNPNYDVALLKLSESKPNFLNDDKSRTKFGELGDKTYPAEGYGFPNVQRFENRQNPEHLKGDLSKIAGLRENQLRLQVTSLVPINPEGWKGMSGTALFVQDHLVGIITETDKGFREKALWATPISLLADISDFKSLVNIDDLKIIHPKNVFYDFFAFILRAIPWTIGGTALLYAIYLSFSFYKEQVNQKFIQSQKDIIFKCGNIQKPTSECLVSANNALKKLVEKDILVEEINLEDANLQEINLDGAKFPNSNFSNASFYKASLVKSNLSGGKSNLFRTDFRLANLSYSNLSESVLFEANFSGANLDNVVMAKAKAPSANFSFANLRKANLTEINLQKANLRGADLREAILTEADIINADLQGANLKGTDLRDVKILRDAIYGNNDFITQITSACFWREARYSDEILKLLPTEDNKNPSSDCSFWQE